MAGELLQELGPVTDMQRAQARTLLDGFHKNQDAVLSTEQRIQASLEQACQVQPSPYTTAELCDRTELLLTSTALRLEVDLSLILTFVHCVLKPTQVACFVAASYPLRPDWRAICSQLASTP